MKRTITGLALAAALLGVLPGQAGVRVLATKSFTLPAATPCAAACVYSVNPDDPELVATGLISEADWNKQIAYGCTDPGPEGSFKDRTLTAPRYAKSLRVTVYPSVDWDLFVCYKPSRGPAQFKKWSANAVDRCQIECTETVSISVRAGYRYIIRAYSYSDPNPLPARYWFYG